MKAFERGALAVVAVLVVGVAVAAIRDPSAPIPGPPRAFAKLPPAPPSDAALSEAPEAMVAAAGPTGAVGLKEMIARLDYDLEAVGSRADRVPRVFLASLPDGLASLYDLETRKEIFIKTVLPLILRVNEQILDDRRRLWRLHDLEAMGRPLDARDRLWLAVMSDRYGVEEGDVTALLMRVDIVPPSLALAQSAEESGWGTSRFVRDGNALFGQWVFAADGHLTPLRRDAGKNHKVKAFDRLIESVQAYALNLNTHPAYRNFRRTRGALRRQGRPLDGWTLIGTLEAYSERGPAYLASLRAIISVNNLGTLDGASLDRLAADRESST